MCSYKLNDFVMEIDKEMRSEAFKNGFYYQNCYLILHNEVCPLCKNIIKFGFNKKLNKVGTIGMILIEKERLCISYALCKRCSKKIVHFFKEEKKSFEDVIKDHIITKINWFT